MEKSVIFGDVPGIWDEEDGLYHNRFEKDKESEDDYEKYGY